MNCISICQVSVFSHSSCDFRSSWYDKWSSFNYNLGVLSIMLGDSGSYLKSFILASTYPLGIQHIILNLLLRVVGQAAVLHSECLWYDFRQSMVCLQLLGLLLLLPEGVKVILRLDHLLYQQDMVVSPPFAPLADPMSLGWVRELRAEIKRGFLSRKLAGAKSLPVLPSCPWPLRPEESLRIRGRQSSFLHQASFLF